MMAYERSRRCSEGRYLSQYQWLDLCIAITKIISDMHAQNVVVNNVNDRNIALRYVGEYNKIRTRHKTSSYISECLIYLHFPLRCFGIWYCVRRIQYPARRIWYPLIRPDTVPFNKVEYSTL